MLLAIGTAFGSFLLANFWLAIFCMIGAIVTESMIICCGFGRKVPQNYIVLFAFTFFESIVVATICAQVNSPFIVLTAALLTSILVLSLTAYAWYTKDDFTV